MGTLQKQRVKIGATATVLLGAIALCLLGLLVVGIFLLVKPFGTQSVDRSGPTVLQQIKKLEEFTAAEGTFTQDVDLETDAKYLPSFLKGERVTALVTGTVRATVNFAELDAGAIQVDESTNTIRLTLPDPVLSDADIDESSARIVSRNRGLVDRVDDFFSSNPTDDAPLYQAAEKKVGAAASKSDLVEQGRQNTEDWLTTFLGAAGFEHVEITWKKSPA
ncbi:MAG: DUF4230 domain-containing protein [Actinomycetes bacterium]